MAQICFYPGDASHSPFSVVYCCFCDQTQSGFYIDTVGGICPTLYNRYRREYMGGVAVDLDCGEPFPANPLPTEDEPCGHLGQCCLLGDSTSHESTLACCQGRTEDGSLLYEGHWADESSPFSCSGRCCGCDWCCNNYDAVACQQLRQDSLESLPDRYNPPPYRKPSCRVQEFSLGKRPPQHFPPEVLPDPGGRHEPFSTAPIRAIDRSGQLAVECRISYATVARDDFTGAAVRRRVGWLCNNYNRNQPAEQRAVRQRCVMVKRADGRHSFDCSFRTACPERPTVCQ